jgi:uncharacterized protein (TIGR03067 family)
MKPALLGVTVCLSSLFAVGSEAQKDTTRLQGKWKVVSVNTGSPERDQEMLERWSAIDITGNTIQVVSKIQSEKLTFKIDPTKKPKEIDLYGGPGGATPDVPLLGIYALDRDVLKLSWSKVDGKFRPTSFELPPDQKRMRQIVLVLKRMNE